MTFKILSYGPSLASYKQDKWPTIGMNHIFQFQPVDYLLVIDNFRLITQQQFTTICQSTPKKFFARSEVWNFMQNYNQITLFDGKMSLENMGNLSTIDNPKSMPYSNNTPFVAAIMAYHMGAKTIVLYGVDFEDDLILRCPNLLPGAINDFKALSELLDTRGCKLYVSSNKSRLSQVLPVYPNYN